MWIVTTNAEPCKEETEGQFLVGCMGCQSQGLVDESSDEAFSNAWHMG